MPEQDKMIYSLSHYWDVTPAGHPAPPRLLYQCQTCLTVYNKRSDAVQCEARGRPWETSPEFVPGQLVVTGGDPQYGRWGTKTPGRFTREDVTTDPDWAIRVSKGLHSEYYLPGGRHEGKPPPEQYKFIWVVTAVGPSRPRHKFTDRRNAHRPRYYVATLAITLKDDQPYTVYTGIVGHVPLRDFDPEEYGIDAARMARIEAAAPALIGRKRDILL